MAKFRATGLVRDGQVILFDPLALDEAEIAQIRGLGTVQGVFLASPFHERHFAKAAAIFGVPF